MVCTLDKDKIVHTCEVKEGTMRIKIAVRNGQGEVVRGWLGTTSCACCADQITTQLLSDSEHAAVCIRELASMGA